MQGVFEIIVIAVPLVALVLCVFSFFQPFAAIQEIGRTGLGWFEHTEDHDAGELPDGNVNDPPIPHRPLRPRA